jgi:hypothetical protein
VKKYLAGTNFTGEIFGNRVKQQLAN